ncbi:hypothetical protein BD780_000853 [Clostridium tetanomorphum]|uniref:Uncharacterized protein n=2 Tax=Clostridium tetanomorphum TaxID=1553 RepID=A0A923EBS8_CLOTT|nr:MULTISPECIES: hypothetical protein [Clostridium]KAJ48751.1 hypothetical protein CTM_26840 [Clostridium tetanomorphum DSM 665]KAJ53125.1 hypothetical protein CTM_04305 [Clostridium tetanomorphum DSM 665]MBC2398811.1 hypothetical protein [Clostridium tetanomorphum]MBP1863529.1 hypothetical protein [Clostridium tetanomorphum]NRS83628.1 hypothetical protein [Clostridium tetanomorphum]
MWKGIVAMRIYIREKNGKRFFIPIPLSIASLGCRIASYAIEKSGKNLNQQQRDIIDCIDFNELAKSIKYLKGYRGLKLVEVTSADGDEVTITL